MWHFSGVTTSHNPTPVFDPRDMGKHRSDSRGHAIRDWEWPGFHVIKITSPLSSLVAVGEEEDCHPVTQRGNFYSPDSMQPRGHQSSQLGCFILKVFSEGRWAEWVTELWVQKRKKVTRASALKYLILK